jgi:hypothetical protein
VGVWLAVLAPLVPAGAVDADDPARTFLTGSLLLTQGDLRSIDAGRVVSRTVPSEHPREVGTVGVVRIAIPPSFYVERLADIAAFKQDDRILQIGTFSRPPRVEDLSALTLDEADLRRLRDCRVHDCGVQFSAGVIERLGREVQWNAPDASARTHAIVREALVDYVQGYRHGAARAHLRYADEREPTDLRAEFLGLIDGGDAVWRHFPGLRRHLVEFPGAAPPGTEDVIYWSKETVRGPVVSVTHLAIAPAPHGSPADYAIASRQIYATHYFDASLGLTLLLRDRAAATPATYVAYVNRTRIDLFEGFLGSIARRVTAGRARTLVAEQLGRLQRRLEAEHRAAATRP